MKISVSKVKVEVSFKDPQTGKLVAKCDCEKVYTEDEKGNMEFSGFFPPSMGDLFCVLNRPSVPGEQLTAFDLGEELIAILPDGTELEVIISPVAFTMVERASRPE